jgi:hypothetical protein
MRFKIIDKGSVSADIFIEFLKRLIKGAERKFFVSADRSSAHHAKKVSAFVETWTRNCACSFCRLMRPITILTR